MGRVPRITMIAAALAATCAAAMAQEGDPPILPTGYALSGTPGLIDLPTALMAPDAELAFGVSHAAGNTRVTTTFQILPRLSGSFRYAKQEGVLGGEDNFDRSFDLRWQVRPESRRFPAVAVGLNDFVGTGRYSGEYVVATKTLTPRFRGTIGIGWGRLAGADAIPNPFGLLSDRFDTRPTERRGEEGGGIEFDRIFRGDAALFGGLSVELADGLTAKVEYSPDDYRDEREAGEIDRRTPLNVGIDWRVREGLRLQGALLHGDAVAVGLTLATNPRRPIANGGTDAAPPPVLVRTPSSGAAPTDAAWSERRDERVTTERALRTALVAQGMTVEGLRLDARAARVLLRPGRWSATPQAVGRAMRVMTRTLPPSVETFTVVPLANGMPTASVTLPRSALETLENASDAAWRSYVRARIDGAADAWDGAARTPGFYPRLRWSIGPYVDLSYFDPDSPVRTDLGVAAGAFWEPRPGVRFGGVLHGRVVGNRDDIGLDAPSALPRVRTDTFRYLREDVGLSRLTGRYQFRPGRDLYARVTAGYLELAYGGVSAELLWKPVRSPLGLGVEVNYARQRAFDDPFAFRDYGVVTGHASAYWRMADGFDVQLDAGRYLAGDVGATLSVDRTFANGWSIGAFATKTNVSSEDFGEGAFDKGLRLTIPLDHYLGRTTGRSSTFRIRSIQRDGGARLAVADRLYGQVRDDHDPELRRDWGRFWR